MPRTFGPQTPECDYLHGEKYRSVGESFREAMTRVASALSDNERHFQAFREILLDQRFLPGGRIQQAAGATRATTLYNCFVSGTIEDSFTHGQGCIMERAREAAETMRMGGGIGYDFSTLRPRGDVIRKLQSYSSGAVSFMDIFNSVGLACSSSGHRRGAQMAVLRCDHPDVEEFLRAKQKAGALLGFNISIGVTNEFMLAVQQGTDFDLRFRGKIYRTIDARALFDAIMRSNYDWSEPGILFLDTINNMNNLYYCETISATNPCGEQPLPPYGACLLGSVNLPKFLTKDASTDPWHIDYLQLYTDLPHIIRAMDNAIEIARYPLHEQEEEARSKRRMGIGVTGVANALEAQGYIYGTPHYCHLQRIIGNGIRDTIYKASASLAKEKGPFPLFDKDRYLAGGFISTLPDDVLSLIEQYGIRNSHLLSIAPTGTISLTADNVSSGIEPVYSYNQRRLINYPTGAREVTLEDYGVKYLGVHGKTAEECTANDHLNVLIAASSWVDSAVSKTCNVAKEFPWDDFKQMYFTAWKNGCKGCTTHRTGNFRGAILTSADDPEPLAAAACEIDPETGRRDCA